MCEIYNFMLKCILKVPIKMKLFHSNNSLKSTKGGKKDKEQIAYNNIISLILSNPKLYN